MGLLSLMVMGRGSAPPSSPVIRTLAGTYFGGTGTCISLQKVGVKLGDYTVVSFFPLEAVKGRDFSPRCAIMARIQELHSMLKGQKQLADALFRTITL